MQLFAKIINWFYPLDTVSKLNIYKTFRRRLGRLLNVLCTISVYVLCQGIKAVNYFRKISWIIIIISWIFNIRSGYRTVATSKMEHFVQIVNGWKLLTIITKSSVLDVAAVLDQGPRSADRVLNTFLNANKNNVLIPEKKCLITIWRSNNNIYENKCRYLNNLS